MELTEFGRSGGTSRPPGITRAGRRSGRVGTGLLGVIGAAIWVGATISASANFDTGDGQATLNAFVVGGSAYFAVLFGSAVLGVRRRSRRTTLDLYEELAVAPVPATAVRQLSRRSGRAAYVHVCFGAVLTAMMLLAIRLREDGGEALMLAMVPVLGVWVFVAFGALRTTRSATSATVAPLGLELTATPTYLISFLSGRGWLVGEMAYTGVRHGRAVSVSQSTSRATTAVTEASDRCRLPRSPEQMAWLTGTEAAVWDGVRVTLDGGTVFVTREANGAGRWFLHDLLLAEAVARGSTMPAGTG